MSKIEKITNLKNNKSLKPTEDEAKEAVRTLIKWAGDDPQREGLIETPRRVVKSYKNFFSGYNLDPREILTKKFREVDGYDEIIILKDIRLESHCEHHMVPFVGKAHVAYIPNGRVLGLSKIARVVDAYAKRLQVQEKLTAQIADAIQDALQPQGVAVILKCRHFCMCYRGVKKTESWTTTSKLHGLFMNNPATRMELFTLLGNSNNG